MTHRSTIEVNEMVDILVCDDAEMRGAIAANFKVICKCGSVRKFSFTNKMWDVYPCPNCGASGMSNVEVLP